MRREENKEKFFAPFSKILNSKFVDYKLVFPVGGGFHGGQEHKGSILRYHRYLSPTGGWRENSGSNADPWHPRMLQGFGEIMAWGADTFYKSPRGATGSGRVEVDDDDDGL